MREFLVPVREGKDDFGTMRVVIPELDYKPEVVAVYTYRNGAREEFLGWGGKIWRQIHMHSHMGMKGQPIDLASFQALIAEKPRGTVQAFAQGDWANPFHPKRDSFSNDPRRANPIRKGMRKEAKKVIREQEIQNASANLFVHGDRVFRSVDDPVWLVMGHGVHGVSVQVQLPDQEGFVEGRNWNGFRADRLDDAEAFAQMYAERTGGKSMPRVSDLEVIYTELFSRNDVVDPAREAFWRLTGLVDRYGPNPSPESKAIAEQLGTSPISPEVAAAATKALSPEILDLASEAERIANGGMKLDTVEAADEAYSIIGKAAEVLREVRPIGNLNFDERLEATRFACDIVHLRYTEFDRNWLQRKDMVLGPRF